MPAGELFFRDEYGNWKDAYEVYGISFDQTALSTLMTPPPNKAYIDNKSRLNNGKRVIVNSPKVDERSLTLTFNLTANSEDQFFSRYYLFCNLLSKGKLELKTKYQTVVYRMVYESCSQFSQLMRGIAKFSLKLTEPDPTDRAEKSKYE